ncbi:hypothetical protein BDZ97DRAFT_1848457 [Flammula alnicola]|nr:hypothetical protein BDZ97DRAFT_1848457 [Flammula alnicola]
MGIQGTFCRSTRSSFPPNSPIPLLAHYSCFKDLAMISNTVSLSYTSVGVKVRSKYTDTVLLRLSHRTMHSKQLSLSGEKS